MTKTVDFTVAQEIMRQLGDNKFVAMTGANKIVASDNGLRFNISSKNLSKANRIKIILTPMDTYTMQFIKVSGGWQDHKTFEWHPEVETILKEETDIYCTELQKVFTENTGYYTHL